MAMMPVRRDPAPLVARPHVARPRIAAGTEREPTIDQRIGAAVDAAVAEALKKVSTPEDQELAKQQAAFDRMMAQRAEQQREANAIRDMGLEQLKRDDDILKKWIAMI